MLFHRHGKKEFSFDLRYLVLVNVYIELVVFNNLAVDLCISLATLAIRRKRVGKIRLILTAITGAAVATAFAIAPKWGQILVKVLLAPLMCALLSKCEGDKAKEKICDYLKTLICFCLVTYFVGGIVYGLSYAFNVDIKSYAILGIVATAAFVCIAVGLVIAKKRSVRGKVVKDVEIDIDGVSFKLKGLCDSGNLLTDDLSGLPVVILSKSACEKIGKRTIEGFVNAHTVNGDKCMPVVRFDTVKVGEKAQNALGALCEQNFGDYDIILQNSMF